MVFLAFIFGCGEDLEKSENSDVVDDILTEQTDATVPDATIPTWHYVPSRDVTLQVPEKLVKEGFKPTGKDKSLLLSPFYFVMSDSRIYMSDRSGMNIYAFDFNGVMIEKERMSRPAFSVKPPENTHQNFRSTLDESGGFIISDNGNMISQITYWVGGGTDDLVTWFIQREGEYQRKKFIPARDGDVAPVFYMDDYMWTLQTGLENHLPDFILYGYDILTGDRIRQIPLDNEGVDRSFFVQPRAFVTEEHIYISYWEEEDNKDFKVWTKGGRSIGRCNVISGVDGISGNFHYHTHSKTLYAFDILTWQIEKEGHKYILRAFQHN